MSASPDIALMGLRGSGKSTLGLALAERLGRRFVDLDDRTLARCTAHDGATIAEVFRVIGEPAFRKAEAAALRESLGERDIVLALGGGTPFAPGAADDLRAAQRRGELWVCYLRCRPETLRRRLREAGGAGADRPSLTGADPLDEIDEIHFRRDPLYRELADATLEGDQSVDSLLRALQSRDQGSGTRD